MRLVLCLAAALSASPVAAMECAGRNLFDDLSAERMAEIRAASEKVPFSHGIFWQAQKGDQKLTITGTYHFDDPRHQATIDQFGPVVDQSALLLVEAGPVEQKKLADTMADEPQLLINLSGPTLPERMKPEEWDQLSAAMNARGIPGVVASKMKPWYVSMMLGISPCLAEVMARTGDARGLDMMMIERAEAADVPIRALEPWDTIFSLFEGMSPAEEIDMIRATMPAAEYADDYTVTLTDSYFRGDIWDIWEFGRFDAYENSGLTRAEVDRQFQFAQDKLMDQRNESWIAPINTAAAEAAAKGKQVFVAFGALHLPGEQGVLRLLEKDGWTIRPVPANGG